MTIKINDNTKSFNQDESIVSLLCRNAELKLESEFKSNSLRDLEQLGIGLVHNELLLTCQLRDTLNELRKRFSLVDERLVDNEKNLHTSKNYQVSTQSVLNYKE